MSMPKLITYCSDSVQIQTAIQAGVSELILEHSYLSIRSLDLVDKAGVLDPRIKSEDDICYKKKIDLAPLIELAIYARSLKPDIQLSVCWDWMAYGFHFKFVDSILEDLSAAGLIRIRLCDIGLMFYIRKKMPSAHLILMHDTFHVNRESIQQFAKYAQGQVLSHLLCLDEIRDIVQAVQTDFEVLIHGNLFLHHSPTRYLSLAHEAGFVDEWPLNRIQLQDQDHPTRLLTAFENKHGFFILNDFQRCLWSYQKELLDLNLSGWIIDVRGYSLDYFKTVLEAYSRFSISQPKFEYGDYSLKPGFFKAARFDLRKKRVYQDYLSDHKIMGMVVESSPKKWMIVELEQPLHQSDVVQIVTPEDVVFSYQIPDVLAVSDREVASDHQLVKIFISKTVPPRSILALA